MRIPSSSVIPAGDPTLLLTNAGMVQFKPYFTGEMIPPSSRLTSVQKCFRTTDIDSVGDSTHLTFFEMLGNFSVGDYFKEEAIAHAWEFVTKHLKLDESRLWVTVYLDDDEAFGYWSEKGRLPVERIRRFGEEDNFWGPAGNEGPCGPCSEINYDFGDNVGCCQANCGPNCQNIISTTGLKCDRFVELWNLVFMQYYQSIDGTRTLLPSPNIDTGMGLERCAVVLQGKRNVYETDLFQALIQSIADLSGSVYGIDQEKDAAMRAVAEHARAAAFLVADGVTPDNKDRGYILRRLIRRAVYLARANLAVDVDYMSDMARSVIALMNDNYPELLEKENLIVDLLDEEEKRFSRTIDQGREILERIADYRCRYLPQELIQKAIADSSFLKNFVGVDFENVYESSHMSFEVPVIIKKHIDDQFKQILGEEFWSAGTDKYRQALSQADCLTGKEIFVLWDTYGFPFELTKEIASDYELKVNDKSLEDFHNEMENQRAQSRAAGETFSGDLDVVRSYQELAVDSTIFIGYENLFGSTVVIGLLADGNMVNQAMEGERIDVILKETPFYAEMGGQLGDSGEIICSSGTLRVEDTYSPISGLTVHTCTVVNGVISHGDVVEASVNLQRRQDMACNHTATHMLHAALRNVLGPHVRQHGSLVATDRLRFDFTHVRSLTKDELREVERLTNEKIRENVSVNSSESTYREAISRGALAFFGDRYGDQVRVVEVSSSTNSEEHNTPFSLEVCGGTHVKRTGDIGYCHIISESNIGSGLRRIEAVTGRLAEVLMASQSATLDALSQRLQVSHDELTSRIENVLTEFEQITRKTEILERDLLKLQINDLSRKQVAEVNVISGELKVSNSDLLREAGDWLKNDLMSGVIVLGTVLDGRPSLMIMATVDIVEQGFHAGNVAREAARSMGGGGGGRPELGQAGGRDYKKLKDALNAVEEEVRLWREKP